MPTVCVTPAHFHSTELEYVQILQKAGFEVRFIDSSKHNLQDPATLIAQLGDCVAVLANPEPYTAEVLAKCKLRVISRAGVGFDSVDLEAATDRGIVVTRTPGVLHEAVAEQTLAFLFAISRSIIPRDRDTRMGRWQRAAFPRLKGQTLGLLGLGPIGRCVAEKALALGLKVIASDPYAALHDGVELVTLDHLWGEADIISLHVPCTPETAHIINRATLGRMKQGAVLINTSRGGLVDEAALVEALTSGQLAAAGLDVFEEEPTSPDNPLLKLDNVVLAPHVAGLDNESLRDMANMAAENIVALYRGEWPTPNVVNPEVRPLWKW
ncbi:phosphoglycerate dehydrogenase [Blastopirellula marina]|uniref:3-phosphoglycerate dehydrogenase n=1 Tax=Blastopirellula marina TaxID=124 RepID=A0A2S8G0J1_9BACT|nr:phosphoglycerate dehydrogenase [Blastopirellula marina]PQO37957.1 3-phosphoglycerate dehydrogenase [Blastopirellula marina]PTL44613.1 3-phosphoglycerate dehydrogenase [Blastopirellula marina]